MTAISKSSFIFLAVLITLFLVSCADPATREEDLDEEEVQEEIEAEDEGEIDEGLDENDSEANQDSSSDSGFTHTVEMDINGEVTEGEGDGWWDDVDENGSDHWWDDD